jgi:hypothetical protein
MPRDKARGLAEIDAALRGEATLVPYAYRRL